MLLNLCRAEEKDKDSVNIEKLTDETKQILQALGTDEAKKGARISRPPPTPVVQQR